MLASDLSIVIQGALNFGNAESVAANCRHWRNLFPEAEIILSISSTDVIGLSVDGNALRLDVTSTYQERSVTRAIVVLNTSCDKIALSDLSRYLPQIKTDRKAPNNINYQIIAAKNGLSLASKKYVLRIRNDCIFVTKKFIDEYLYNVDYFRGGRAFFTNRVMIPSIYTLNPYSRERMPFHYSDWFHFGLLIDVVNIWNIPEYSFADSVYYVLNPHAPHSNSHERKFLTRLAVEQYISFTSFSAVFSDVKLEYHNDIRSIEESIDILCDNFVVCDTNKIDLFFPKYQTEIIDENNFSKCISHAAWRALCSNTGGNYENIIAENNMIADVTDKNIQDSYRPVDFLVKDSKFTDGEISNTGNRGLLAYGPYLDLEPGRYRCHFSFSEIRGRGRIRFSVTSNAGQFVIKNKLFRNWIDKKRKVTLKFDVQIKKKEEYVEFITRYYDLKSIIFSGFYLEKI